MTTACFAYSNKKVCKALEVRECADQKCPFFRTKKQMKQSHMNAYKRISGLDELTQQRIASMYFQNKMPWLKGGVNYDC